MTCKHAPERFRDRVEMSAVAVVVCGVVLALVALVGLARADDRRPMELDDPCVYCGEREADVIAGSMYCDGCAERIERRR